MKKILAIGLAAVMLAMAATPAFAAINGIFVGTDENGVNLLNDRLRPGEDYLFPVQVAVDGTPPAQLTSADLDRNRLEVRVSTGGQAIESAEIEEKNGLVYLALTPAAKGTTQEQPVTLRLNYRSRDSQQNLTVTPSARVGYYPLPDDRIEALEPGEFLELDNLSPLILPYQWEKLAKMNDQKTVTMHGIGWRFTAYTGGVGKRNMVVNHDPVMKLVEKYPDHQMHFIGFPGEPDFEIKGQMALDVSDLAEEYGHDFFLYRCAYNKVYPLTYQYDQDAGELLFHPSQLSTYLIADRRIDGGTVEEDADDSQTEQTPPVDNPHTGVNPRSWPAALAALVSLAGLGIMTCSKRLP